MEFLVFRLYGPMAAWGWVSVGEQRHSHAHPSRSAVLGLIAAALGVKRHQETELSQINEQYGVAVMAETTGEWLRDYHTVQVPKAKGKAKYHTRRDELRLGDLYTILSQRDYRTDACYTLAIWSRASLPIYSLEDIRAALIRPRFALYLGRKSCPPSLPLRPVIADESTLMSAFDSYHHALLEDEKNLLHELKFSSPINYFWDVLPDGVEAGLPVQQLRRRRDKLLNRERWQFGEREEYTGTHDRGGS